MPPPIFRFAPSSTGYPHLGHAKLQNAETGKSQAIAKTC
jgi:glutamyl/glutaminyl-tRNA synthetase